jgi:hypothetical protein
MKRQIETEEHIAWGVVRLELEFYLVIDFKQLQHYLDLFVQFQKKIRENRRKRITEITRI